MKIPKFENETDEANWAYEHREELATEFVNDFPRQRMKRLEAALQTAAQTKNLVVMPEELEGYSLVLVLREKVAKS
ncbi:MAG: hypothetical protein P4L51_24920 [Puia sp.]|nr:hypothetical protein [Puia sp.]